jgi:DNA repair exonuclease SbcCD ATPase subunit
MWIRSITAHAFGDVVEKTLHLTNGLNIIVGANGTGKSTWHAAMFAALYGVPAETTAAVDRRLSRRKPRRAEGWSVSSTVVLDDDREINITQNLLEPDDSSASEASTRNDVAGEIRRPDGSLDVTPWLGLDRRSFAATAWIEQAYGLLALPDDTSGRALRRAVAAGPGAHAVLPAIDRITQHRERAVGEASDVHSPYGRAVAALHAAEAARTERQSLADRRQLAQSTVDSARQRVEDLRSRLDAARLVEVEAELKRLESELEQARRAAATAAEIDEAVTHAEIEYGQALATLADLEASQLTTVAPAPASRSESRHRLTAWVDVIAGRGRTASSNTSSPSTSQMPAATTLSSSTETSSPTEEARQAVAERRVALRGALAAAGYTLDADDDVITAVNRYRTADSSQVDGSSIVDLEQRVAATKQRAADLRAHIKPGLKDPNASPGQDIPAQPQPPESLPELVVQSERAARAEEEATEALQHIDASIADVALVADGYDAASAECDRLRRLDTVLAATVSRLDSARAAVYQAVAAELEHHVQDWLGDVTDGRYTSVHIDPEWLDVRIAGPDEPEVDAFEDSQGTSELVQLLLRLALFLRGRGTEHGPLLLDDSFAHLDSERATALVDVLAKIAKRHKHQVILFTTREATPGSATVRLTGTRDEPVSVDEPV